MAVQVVVEPAEPVLHGQGVLTDGDTCWHGSHARSYPACLQGRCTPANYSLDPYLSARIRGAAVRSQAPYD